jgi:hypothetical protein
MDVIELSSIILVLWVFPTPEAMCPLEWFFHRLHVLLVGDLAGTSLVKWMVGSRGRGDRAHFLVHWNKNSTSGARDVAQATEHLAKMQDGLRIISSTAETKHGYTCNPALGR